MAAWVLHETSAPKLGCSSALVDTVMDDRFSVPKMLTLLNMAKIADINMLSLVVVMNTLVEVRSIALFLRARVELKGRKLLVCEFLIGAFPDSEFTKTRTYTRECERQTRIDLRETLRARGIVVCLRRGDVLSNLHAELASIKADKSESPGSTICFTTDVAALNLNVSLMMAVRKLARFNETYLRNCVMSKARSGKKSTTDISTTKTTALSSNVCKLIHPCPVASSSYSSKLTSHKKSSTKSIICKSKDSRATPKVVVQDTLTQGIYDVAEPARTTVDDFAEPARTKVDDFDDEEVSWPSWEFHDAEFARAAYDVTEVTPGTGKSVWWRPRVDYSATPAEELRVSDIMLIRAETKASFEWCDWYREKLVVERERLAAARIPNCIGIMLAMEFCDEDDAETAAYISALSGTNDPDKVMIIPHCTVLLSHGPIPLAVSD